MPIDYVYDPMYDRRMTENEIVAIQAAIDALAQILIRPPTRADWLALAGKLRIVLDVDYPVDPA